MYLPSAHPHSLLHIHGASDNIHREHPATHCASEMTPHSAVGLFNRRTRLVPLTGDRSDLTLTALELQNWNTHLRCYELVETNNGMWSRTRVRAERVLETLPLPSLSHLALHLLLHT